MFDVSPEEITDGKLSRALLVLAAPLVAQQVVVALGAVVDIFWLGRLSEASVAAVGLVVPVYALIALPVTMVYSGAQVRRRARRDRRRRRTPR
jgi:Na+-driven multidrug efflux pump